MPVIDNLKKKLAPAIVAKTLADIEPDIDKAEGDLAAAITERASAAMAKYLGEPGAQDRFVKADAAYTAATKTLDDLKLIRDAAKLHEKENWRKERRNALRHAKERITMHFGKRDAYAAELQECYDKANDLYQKIIEHNAEAERHAQIVGINWPHGAFSENTLRVLAGGAAFRGIATDKRGQPFEGMALPGGIPSDLSRKAFAQAQLPLGDVFTADTASMMKALEKEFSE
jgi:hypothetical protein